MAELYTMGYRAGWTPETLLMTMRESNAELCDIRHMPHLDAIAVENEELMK